jgi:D-alanine-D-alanine ligase
VGTYAYYDEALVERFYPGANVSVVVRDTEEGPVPLAPIEIDFVKGHEFDFSARYTAEFVGLRPLDLPGDVVEEVGRAAVRAHQVLGLRDVSRSDFIVSDDGSFVVLETAITPGTTETSVFPFACTASGTTLGEVARGLVERALARS